ncbi:MAG: two-component regulator propeller domain-containing protein [Gammaproteobacteria bacterium]
MSRLALYFILCVNTISANALDATRQPSQLIHASWSRTDGIPAESVWAVHQSADGYMWIGTEGGLVRFDGIEFKVFSSLTHEAFRADDVRSVVEGPPGTLWVSTYGGGVVRMRDGEFTRYDKSNGLIHDVVYSAVVADNNDVWVGTAIGACRLRNEEFTCWSDEEGLAKGRILRVAKDARGRIWFATIGGGVSSYDGTKFTRYSIEEGLGSAQIFMLIEDPVLDVVLGTYAGDHHHVVPDGLEKLDRGELPSDLIPLTGFRDRQDNFWVGGNANGGLWRMLPDTQRLDDPNDPLTHIFGLTEDRNGGLWAGSASGLHHYRAGPFTPWGEPEGVANGAFVVVAAANDDGVWMGAEGEGLFHVGGDGKVTRFTEKEGLPMSSVSALHLQNDGTLWAGTFGGGVALVRDNKIASVLTKEQGLLHDQISAIYRDSDGATWIGSAGGLNRWFDGKITHSLTVADGLVANLVRYIGEDRDRNLLISSDSGLVRLSLYTLQFVDMFDRESGLAADVVASTYVDRGGAIWIGQRSGGLARLDGDKLFRFERRHELGIDSIMTIIEDYEGYFWLAAEELFELQNRIWKMSSLAKLKELPPAPLQKTTACVAFGFLADSGRLRPERVTVDCGLPQRKASPSLIHNAYLLPASLWISSLKMFRLTAGQLLEEIVLPFLPELKRSRSTTRYRDYMTLSRCCSVIDSAVRAKFGWMLDADGRLSLRPYPHAVMPSKLV